MEPTKNPSPDVNPHRPAHPLHRRPVLDGFSTHRPTPPAQPQRPATPKPVSDMGGMRPVGTPVTRPLTPQGPRPAAPVEPRHIPPAPDELPPSRTKSPKEHNQTGHAGLVGLIVFVILAALLLSPVIPGKLFQSFPGASESFSTGDSTLDCLGTQGAITSNTTYNTKAGSPITYTYSTTTSQSATCNGKEQTTVIGHTSQFNPLGLVIDLAVTLIVAVLVAKVWRKLFGEKPNKR